MSREWKEIFENRTALIIPYAWGSFNVSSEQDGKRLLGLLKSHGVVKKGSK